MQAIHKVFWCKLMPMKCSKGQMFLESLGRCVPKNKPYIEKIKIKRHPDSDPDLSWLETEYDEDSKKIISSMRYTNEDIKKYGWAKVKKWIDQDQERLNSYGSDWEMMGIIAEAELYIPKKSYHTPTWQIQKITSGGLWGIESDSGEEYLKSVEKEQIDDLEENLMALGVSKKEFKQALKHSLESE